MGIERKWAEEELKKTVEEIGWKRHGNYRVKIK